MSADSIDYPALVQSALRGVMRDALARAAESGMPGEHHFYIGFRTRFPGVEIAPRLRARFPDEMTIVLQHRFWDLRVEDKRFAVTLTFGGASERLAVPFAAVTSFADPAADFALRFEAPGGAKPAAPRPAPAAAPRGAGKGNGAGDGADDESTVVAVDFPRRGKREP